MPKGGPGICEGLKKTKWFRWCVGGGKKRAQKKRGHGIRPRKTRQKKEREKQNRLGGGGQKKTDHRQRYSPLKIGEQKGGVTFAGHPGGRKFRQNKKPKKVFSVQVIPLERNPRSKNCLTADRKKKKKEKER